MILCSGFAPSCSKKLQPLGSYSQAVLFPNQGQVGWVQPTVAL